MRLRPDRIRQEIIRAIESAPIGANTTNVIIHFDIERMSLDVKVSTRVTDDLSSPSCDLCRNGTHAEWEHDLMKM